MPKYINTLRLLAVTFLIAFAALASLNASKSGQASNDGEVEKSQETGLAKFLSQNCEKCHGPKKQLAELDLSNLDFNIVSGKDAVIWRKILQRVTLGEMPPKSQERPNPQQRIVFLASLKGELAKRGKGEEVVESFTGNHVDHDLLFSSDSTFQYRVPPRIWPISPQIYETLMDQLGRNRVAVAQPFSSNIRGPFKDMEGAFLIDESTTTQLIRNARAVVEFQTNYKIENDKVRTIFGSTREFVELLDPKTQPDQAKIDKAIRKQFDLVLLREPTEQELKRVRELMIRGINESGRVEGVRTALAAVLLMPEVLYRHELGNGRPDAKGRLRLTPREIAFAISYTLTDRRPDRQLLNAAEKGELDTDEGVRKQIKQILNNPKTKTPRILRFFQEYFGYTDAIEVFKETKEFKNHDARVLVADTNQLIEHILNEDKNVLAELLTTNRSFVNYRLEKKNRQEKVIRANRRDIHESYNLSDWQEKQPVRLPAEERAGILTQPSWLVAFSQNTDNHAIHRGKWVRERLLGGTVPDVPITVDAQLPEDPEKTLRQRMTVTQQAYCWNCHQYMNPLGLTFESYDHFGRYRTTELEKPVDATGSVEHFGDPKVEGSTPNAVAMLKKLAKSRRVQQVFIRHAFRYFLGRNETLGDGPSLRQADEIYTQSGGSMKALLISLLSSESFLYRVPPITATADSKQ